LSEFRFAFNYLMIKFWLLPFPNIRTSPHFQRTP
jgi:hypothetical protein